MDDVLFSKNDDHRWQVSILVAVFSNSNHTLTGRSQVGRLFEKGAGEVLEFFRVTSTFHKPTFAWPIDFHYEHVLCLLCPYDAKVSQPFQCFWVLDHSDCENRFFMLSSFFKLKLLLLFRLSLLRPAF